MFCPGCGQEQLTEETRFCSRCGLLLTGIAQIVENGGELPQNLISADSKDNSPRKKGIRQGIFFILICLMIIPLLIALSVALDIPPAVSIIFAFVTIGSAILRIVYAIMFESNNQKGAKIIDAAQPFLNKKPNQKNLPEQQIFPVSSYEPPKQGNWRETNDLTPTSVTENTTKLFKNE